MPQLLWGGSDPKTKQAGITKQMLKELDTKVLLTVFFFLVHAPICSEPYCYTCEKDDLHRRVPNSNIKCLKTAEPTAGCYISELCTAYATPNACLCQLFPLTAWLSNSFTECELPLSALDKLFLGERRITL